jgi:hypothetical protein
MAPLHSNGPTKGRGPSLCHASLPREILKWTQSLGLSFSVKHPKRDFASGFLIAEMMQRYYGADVPMHSFGNSNSMEGKKAAWDLLWKLFMVSTHRVAHAHMRTHTRSVCVCVCVCLTHARHHPSTTLLQTP